MNTRGMCKSRTRNPNEMNEGGAAHEENVSAQEKTEKEGAWLQKENVHC